MTKGEPQETSLDEYRAMVTKGGNAKCKTRSAPNLPSAAPARRDGLTTMLVRGWSNEVVPGRGERLYRINGASTAWCEDTATAVLAAKALEQGL